MAIKQKCKSLEIDRNKELCWIQRQGRISYAVYLKKKKKKSFMEDVNLGIILGGRSLEREKCIPGREGRINRSETRKHMLCLHIVIYTSLASGQAFVIDYWKIRLENWLEPDGGSIECPRECVVIKVCKQGYFFIMYTLKSPSKLLDCLCFTLTKKA